MESNNKHCEDCGETKEPLISYERERYLCPPCKRIVAQATTELTNHFLCFIFVSLFM